MSGPEVDISVIIPTLDEVENLPSTLAGLQGPATEVIVVDGGSTDGTQALARDLGATVLPSRRGRAEQMNRGAKQARGDVLPFLHADTQLPGDWSEAVQTALSRDEVAVGAFRLRTDSRRPLVRFIAWTANIRSRFGRPYGDQALFVRRADFMGWGGYPTTELLEDVLFVRRARREGRVALTNSAVITSARRWEQAGVLRCWLTNKIVLFGAAIGVPLPWLARLYDRSSRQKELERATQDPTN